jgi:DNA (cytosine-5)-methyltransferase 1
VDSTQNIISLCTGYGGIELGLRLAGVDVRTVAYVEIEAFACANLVAKIEAGQMDAAPIWTDVKTFPAKEFHGKVHGIIGGYPCQPFSCAGQRQGTDDPRHLWPYIARIVQTVRPFWCFFENVAGHLTLGFPEVYRSLRDMGYKVEAGLFTAAEVGAPHRRERLFILGYSEHNRHLPAEIPRSLRAGSKNSEAGQDATGEPAGPGRQCGQLADTDISRGRQDRQPAKLRANMPEQPSAYCGETNEEQANQKWPSRPGERQHEWEEPRVVGNAAKQGLSLRTSGQMGVQGAKPKPERPTSGGKRKIESAVGEQFDGSAQRLGYAPETLDRIMKQRTDMLRLLGNGVVPQQAALAFRTLSKMFE